MVEAAAIRPAAVPVEEAAAEVEAGGLGVGAGEGVGMGWAEIGGDI